MVFRGYGAFRLFACFCDLESVSSCRKAFKGTPMFPASRCSSTSKLLAALAPKLPAPWPPGKDESQQRWLFSVATFFGGEMSWPVKHHQTVPTVFKGIMIYCGFGPRTLQKPFWADRYTFCEVFRSTAQPNAAMKLNHVNHVERCWKKRGYQ